MGLAIVNLSGMRLSISGFVLDPGAKVPLLSHYRSEEDARKDLDLNRFIAANKAMICEVDFKAIANIHETIVRLEQRDAEERAVSRAAYRQMRVDKIANMRAKADEHRVYRQLEREREEQQPRAEIDLSALYEKTRKERLVRARTELGPTVPQPESPSQIVEDQPVPKRPLRVRR